MSVHGPVLNIAPAALLDRIATELVGCGERLVKFESAIEMLLQSASGTQTSQVLDHDANHTLQDLDLTVQIIGDLVTCLNRVVGSDSLQATKPVDLIDVTGPLLLADVRRRLSGPQAQTTPPQRVELF